MPKPNKNCVNCNNPFYSCTSCVEKSIFYWKSICCCPECFQEYMKKEIERRENENA